MFKSLFKGWDDIVRTDYRARDIIAVEQAALAPHQPAGDKAAPWRGRGALATLHSPLSPMASAPSTPTSAGQQQQQRQRYKQQQPQAAGSWEEGGNTAGRSRLGTGGGGGAGAHKAPEVDVVDLFSGEQQDGAGGMTEKEAVRRTTAWADELEKMESFVLREGKFVRLPEGQVGHFYSEDCYVFLCTQWREVDGVVGDAEEEAEEEMECVAYFWQGRDARRLGWLTFQLSTRQQMEELVMQSIGCKLQVQREYQQQESMRFLALFDRQMVVHRGSHAKEQESTGPRLFCQHAFAPSVFTRVVEVDCEPRQLCSRSNYIMRVPFDGAAGKGIVYVWCGAQSSEEDAYIAQEIGRQKLWGASYRCVCACACASACSVCGCVCVCGCACVMCVVWFVPVCICIVCPDVAARFACIPASVTTASRQQHTPAGSRTCIWSACSAVRCLLPTLIPPSSLLFFLTNAFHLRCLQCASH